MIKSVLRDFVNCKCDFSAVENLMKDYCVVFQTIPVKIDGQTYQTYSVSVVHFSSNKPDYSDSVELKPSQYVKLRDIVRKSQVYGNVTPDYISFPLISVEFSDYFKFRCCVGIFIL